MRHGVQIKRKKKQHKANGADGKIGCNPKLLLCEFCFKKTIYGRYH